MTALLDAVEDATAGVTRLYQLGIARDAMVEDDKGNVKYPYAVMSAVMGRGDVYMNEGSAGIRHGRITVQTFGRTADSALTLMESCVDALADRVLEVDGWDCTPIRLELDPQVNRDPDDQGVVGVTAALTFTATEE